MPLAPARAGVVITIPTWLAHAAEEWLQMRLRIALYLASMAIARGNYSVAVVM